MDSNLGRGREHHKRMANTAYTILEQFMIVIHIGLKKSGSASLQTFLHENAERLRELSMFYPTVGRKTRIAHHNFAHEIHGYKKFDPKLGILTECAQDWGDCAERVMILSSEMFEEVETNEALKMKSTLLENRRSDFRIFLVIRDLVDLIPSSYAQKVKSGF